MTTYSYDALGRLIKRVADVTGIPETTSYWYEGEQVVEEFFRRGPVQATTTFVWGHGDDLLQAKRAALTFYYHQDDEHSVTALSNADGHLVERYEYGDFGQLLDVDTLAPATITSSVSNPVFFRGLRFDSSTAWYWSGRAFADPRAGR